MEAFDPLQIDLRGRVALITGASGDLGRVMARTLAACGATIAIHYRSGEAKARILADELEAQGRKAFLVQGDITRQSDVEAMARAMEAGPGMPDVVVANAVVQYEWKPVLEQDPADYHTQFDCCVMQSVHLAKAFVPAMEKKGWGRFIAINTEVAMNNFPGQSAYSAAKRGLDGLVRVLAREVGKNGVTVNQVAPGWTVSDRDRTAGTEHNAGYESTVPLGRRGTDREIAHAVAFLASDLASFITGIYLPVAGGTVMPGI